MPADSSYFSIQVTNWLLCCHTSLWHEAERNRKVCQGQTSILVLWWCGALWRYPSLLWKALEIGNKFLQNHESDGWRVNQQNSAEANGGMPDCNTWQSLVKTVSVVWMHVEYIKTELKVCCPRKCTKLCILSLRTWLAVASALHKPWRDGPSDFSMKWEENVTESWRCCFGATLRYALLFFLKNCSLYYISRA